MASCVQPPGGLATLGAPPISYSYVSECTLIAGSREEKRQQTQAHSSAGMCAGLPTMSVRVSRCAPSLRLAVVMLLRCCRRRQDLSERSESAKRLSCTCVARVTLLVVEACLMATCRLYMWGCNVM